MTFGGLGVDDHGERAPFEGGSVPVWSSDMLLAETGELAVAPGSVRIWMFSLHGADATHTTCWAMLSDDERARADRFVFARDRARYVLAHGVTRHLLARYAQVPPVTLRFTTSEAGKPSLANPALATVSFNLSHAHDRAMLAVSDGRSIGVDLEYRTDDLDPMAIAGQYFFAHEYDAIARESESARPDVFLRHWVAKEAVLKGEGIGLGFPLDRFHVSPGKESTLSRVESFDPERVAPDWHVYTLPCDTQWFAAVAARGQAWHVVW